MLIVWHANYFKVTRNITPPPDELDISIGFYFFQATLVCAFCNTDVLKVKISYTSVLIVLEMTEVTYLHLTTIGEFGEIFLPNQ